MGDREHATRQVETSEETTGEQEPSRLMFIFHGFNGLLEGYHIQNVSADQLLYLAQWLHWYSMRMKDASEMQKLQEKMGSEPQILVPGQPPLPGDLKV